MRRAIISAVAVLSSAVLASGAQAATVSVASPCEDLSGAVNQNTSGEATPPAPAFDRCLFTGNINTSTSGNSSYLLAQSAYNALSYADITLTPITDTDNADFASFGTAGPIGGLSGNWSLPGYSVEYLAVKGGPDFFLYQIGGASSGTWTTQGLPNPGGGPGLSHLVFFGRRNGAIPEPATWAMMLIGFGAVGCSLRRRKRANRPMPQLA